MTATNQQNSKQQNNTISDYDRALSALQAIPADYQRAEWVGLLGAAKAAGLDDSDIEQWSASSDKYDPRNFKSTIKKISETGGATEASLYWHAMQNGWIDPRKQEGYTPPSPEESEHKQQERAVQKAITNAARIEQERIEGERAAAWANALNRASQPASPAHPYLQRKGIAPTATLRQIDASEAAAILGYAPSAGGKQLAGTLLLAVGKRTTGGLCTAELIDGVPPLTEEEQAQYAAEGKKPPSWRKTAIKGAGTRTGAYWATGKPEAAAVILIAEGIATAISARDGSVLGLGDDAVGVATFSNGNLPDVAAAMRQQYPQAKIVICADVDKATGTVPDKYAVDAAQLVGGYLAVPDFGADRPEGAKDFNDLHQLHGLEAVKACIDAAKLIEPEPAQAEADEGEAWDAPVALPDDLPPVAPFHMELLPDELREWIADIAHRMQQPPDFAAASAIVALSSLVGARAVIRPKQYDDWEVVPNLWGLIVGRPGMLKSPAIKQTHAPLHRLEAAERKQYAQEMEGWELDCNVIKLQNEQAETKAKKLASTDPHAARALLQPAPMPPAPTMRRYIVNDATVEKLGEILQQNPWGVLAFRDELAGLLSGMDKQGQEGSRAFYLQAYDGNQGYTFDRIMRGETYIPRVCLAMFGGIQPSKLQEHIRAATYGGAGDDGLLQRFGIAVWPDANKDYTHIDQYPETPARQAANAVFDRLASLQAAKGEGIEADEEPAVWQFDNVAQPIFNEWYIALELELRSATLPPAMESHISKYRKLIPALALLFALIDAPDNNRRVGVRELARAIGWAKYLRSHAERIYSAASTPDTSAAAALLARMQAGEVPDGCTPRLIVQKGWAWLKTTEEAKKALAMLDTYNWARLEVIKSADPKGRGRPSETIRLNPVLLTGKAYEEMQKGAA